MNDFDNLSRLEDRARAAGDALRSWAPIPSAPADALVGRATRRTRVHRAAGGALAAGVLVAVGFAVLPSDGDDVVTVPPGADTVEPAPTTTEPPTATTTTPSTTVAVDGNGTGDEGGPADSTVPPTSEPTTVAPAAGGTCQGQVTGTDISFEVTLPDGYYANEASQGVGACQFFGPEPVTIAQAESESGTGVSSNAVVRFLPYSAEGMPSSFEEQISLTEGLPSVTAVERTTVDGHPAARIEGVTTPGDDHQGGEPYVRWTIDLGSVWLDAVDTANGTSPAAAEAALDAIVDSLDFTR